jgi:CheY-like chemotaxis protein
MDRKVVLVVEDNEDELLIYTTLLAYHGYVTLTATNFEAALQLATERVPDLAVVDVNLGDPKLDGCDLARVLAEQSRTSGIPIIAHTAYGDVYRRSLQRAGCRTVIHKPSDPGVLLAAVRQLIGPAVRPDAAGRALPPS